MQLFVYGGLLKGMTLAPFIDGSEYLGPAFIKAEIYFLGQFPGIIDGDSNVFGELYEVDENKLPGLDKIEHYHPDDMERSSYIRKAVSVTCLPNMGKLQADAYFYNRSIEGQEHIVHGDYRRFINEYDIEKYLVITSLLNRKTNGFFKSIDNYPISKMIRIDTINGLKADGSHGKKQIEVNVVELQKSEIENLDRESDVPEKYSRVSVPFIDENGDIQMALTYYPNPLL